MKNQLYLVILIVSLAVCGVVMFRPQTADRVLDLLGMQDRATSPIAPEWDDLPPPALSSPPQDHFPVGQNLNGFAVTNSSQAMTQPAGQPIMPPQFMPMIDAPVGTAFGVPAEGFAMSGTRGHAAPDFSVFNAPTVPEQGFSSDMPGSSNFDASSNVIPVSGTSDFPPLPQPHPMTDVPAAGFANFALPIQPAVDTTVSVGANLNSVASASGTTPEASVVMPDQPNGHFNDYLSSMTGASNNATMQPSELDARIIPPAEAHPVTWATSGNLSDELTQSRIVQPIGNSEPGLSEHAVIPVQGMTMPNTSPVAPPIAAPQFQLAPVESPQYVPPTPETPLYVPPQGNPPIFPPVASSPANEAVPRVNGNNSTGDRRGQNELQAMPGIETVFGADMLARIGTKNVIMTCDILAEVRETLDNLWVLEYRKAIEESGITPSVYDEQNVKANELPSLFEQSLNSWIEFQLLYLDMTLSVPSEAVDDMRKKAGQAFDNEIVLKMMEQYGVTNRYDLDEELRKYGTTLERKKENTIQKQLAQGWFHEIVKLQKSMLTQDDMMSYYEAHKEEKYKILGQAQWEELAILFSETANEQEAYAKIAELGNRVMKGESFAEVARQGSQGVTADRGGERKTTVGSLKTKTLENAVFALPLGRMSQIIRDDTGGNNSGFYIVRVIARQDTRYTPFDKVQGEIKNAIYEEQFQKEQERVLTLVRNKYPVVKAGNLQQIIAGAAELERHRPIMDTPERQAKMLAKAERLAPSKKAAPVEQQPLQRIAVAPPRNEIPQNGTLPKNMPPTWEPDLKPAEPEKKKSFFQSLNPFK